ncbi:hypothetical protein ACFW35_12045 [Fictibacillus sp. NPDC058756]|uniref:hypothetical protein n=1 Tax=Fictibacillus sp. NPDC058756 TaxID=3346625 RepID=UPI0036B7478B
MNEEKRTEDKTTVITMHKKLILSAFDLVNLFARKNLILETIKITPSNNPSNLSVRRNKP